MSSLQREGPANPDQEASGQLQRLRRQVQVKGEELQQRDTAMQQLLRGAERIEEAQKTTLQQLARAQLEVGSAFFFLHCILHCTFFTHDTCQRHIHATDTLMSQIYS